MLESWHYPLLFITGLAAGFVDSIAGGGGLITIPVLLSSGLDPRLALGTNKLQATFGSGSAAYHYVTAGTVPLKDCLRCFLLTSTGAAAGAVAVQQLDPGFLRKGIPILLLAVAIYFLVKPTVGHQDQHPRWGRIPFECVFGLGLGFYDGFFGPGTGTFWTMAFVLVLGFNLTRATGYTKVMNFGSNISSLAFFLLGGQVAFTAGIVMGLGQFLGARVGAQLVISKGTSLIRPIFIAVVLAITLRLVYDAYLKV